jgi:hypothetical protein
MTKFILHGGSVWESEDRGRGLAEELVRDAHAPVKILLCYFAWPRLQWEALFAGHTIQFHTFGLNKRFELQMARPDIFLSQLDWADSVLLVGGRESDLRRLLEKSSGWEKKLDGKTIAGSSAGADIIAKYYYNLDTLQLEEGFGLLPIKVLVHYRSDYNAPNIDWDKAEVELKNYKEDPPLITLPEGEFNMQAA